MEHGGDLLTYKEKYNNTLIDFSSNINPLGIPKGLEEELFKGFKDLNRYPDIKYRNLKSEISKYLNCNQEEVLVGNGAVEIINNFIISGKRVVVIKPSFSEYEKRAYANNKEVKKLYYKDGFIIDVEAIKENIQKDDLLIIGNPNNPTGLRIDEETIKKIYKIVYEKEAYLLLDEAFYEFAPKDYDSIEIFKEFGYESIGIIRAATKFFALPGIRLGYACVSRKKANEIQKIELPWSVNTLANTAGQFIIKNKEYIQKSKRYIEKERRYLIDELGTIKGIKAYTTHTNYILIKLLDYTEIEVFDHFLKNGILIRKCSTFEGLKGDHIRIAIKNRFYNEKLINIFKKI